VFPAHAGLSSLEHMSDPQPLRQYICELYFTGPFELAASKARRAAGEVAGDGRGVRYLRTIGVPGDELCLHVFEAESAAALEEVGRRAGTPFDRVVEANDVAVPMSERRRR
jgi:hypothetical protein